MCAQTGLGVCMCVVGVIMQDYNNAWKEHRRFALTTLRNFGMGRTSMEDRIRGEIEYIVNTLEKSNGMYEVTHPKINNTSVFSLASQNPFCFHQDMIVMTFAFDSVNVIRVLFSLA